MVLMSGTYRISHTFNTSESTRESLLNLFGFFENVMLRVQYPGEYLACSRLNHCDSFSHYCASLAEETKKKMYNYAPPPECSDLPVWYSSEAF